MVDKNTLALVTQHLRRWFDYPGDFSIDLDLVALAGVNPVLIQRVLEGIHKDRKMKWPTVPDADGRQQPAQLFIGDALTVGQLCDIVQSGAWPQSWTRPGKYLQAP